MSGSLAGLSQYADSDSDDGSANDAGQVCPTSESAECTGQARVGRNDPQAIPSSTDSSSRRKRKLPPLELESLHQTDQAGPPVTSQTSAGTGTKKVARGDWLCYCFVEVPVERSLSKLIQESLSFLRTQIGSDYKLQDLRVPQLSPDASEAVSFGATLGSSENKLESLHISLTRPCTVRSYEREEYIKVASAEARRLKTIVGSFAFSFSRIAHLSNDDGSRHFVVLEVGSGHEKFHKLSTALSAELRQAFRAKSYYEGARFHASFACLTIPAEPSSTETDEALGPRFSKIVSDTEAKWGARLRKSPPTWATRIGIQVANSITYVDI
ncbi:related to UPF3 - Nonsense-mediated mRNA decay protein [Ustilago trichophora]|uniref:U6 snRNA phosphodiesterase 1 n=1 Tax=Ustilago trichophora TaxID=86804 RepID=A0A5C3E8V4_9BASI|nr:related to UPF3 - Nonsense-mediated mRNA decay protein [Ustilago trichophora]